MKTKLLLAAAWLFAAANLQAAVLNATTAVHTKPDEGAPVVTYISAGTNATASTDSVATTPAGWMAIDLPTPIEAYVPNKDITKSLDVRPGTPLHLLPNPASGVLCTAEKGDDIKINGVRGKWMRLKVNKKIVGFIRISSMPPVATAPASYTSTPLPSAPLPAPVNAEPAPASVASQPVASTPAATQTADLGDSASSMLPRVYEGKFVTTRRAFAPKRPYDFQINDSAGVRFAYVDLSRLMLTDAIEKYIDHNVAVFGLAKNVPGTQDIVIEVDSLQLK
jgi:hypothetical protein